MQGVIPVAVPANALKMLHTYAPYASWEGALEEKMSMVFSKHGLKGVQQGHACLNNFMLSQWKYTATTITGNVRGTKKQ